MSENGAGPDRFVVVINDEEQYSIWPQDKDLPPGWRVDGTAGSKEDCLNHIEKVWLDMRPLSLRKKMADRQAATAG